MRAFVIGGVGAIAVVEVVSSVFFDREAALRFSGVAAAVALLGVWCLLMRGGKPRPVDIAADEVRTPLTRWVERTRSQISWSETTRADWDRRVRPMLARHFELALKQPRARDPRRFEATGRVLFGDELWVWVDPENISRTGAAEKGPGRATLRDIIERLERL